MNESTHKATADLDAWAEGKPLLTQSYCGALPLARMALKPRP